MIQILFNQLENIEKQFKSGTAASGQLYGSLMMMMSEFSEHRSSINPERSDARRLVNSLRDLIIKSGSSLTAAEFRELTGKFNVLIENLTKDTAVSPECFQIDGNEGGTSAPKDDQAEAKPDLYSDYIHTERRAEKPENHQSENRGKSAQIIHHSDLQTLRNQHVPQRQQTGAEKACCE